MSESDDTDLLLLIPPDFFVVHSDSEDSIQSYQRSSSDHRFQELVNEVKKLRERVNFIETKDCVLGESFPDTNRHNQSLDYSLSFDTSNYKVDSEDVALRFYTLTSADIAFGVDNEKATVRVLEPCISRSSESNTNFSHKMLSSPQESKFERSANGNSISRESNQFVNLGISVNHHASSSGIANDGETLYRKLHSSESLNFDFLNEIDAFLEKRDKCLNKKLACNEPSGDKGSGKLNTVKSVVSGKNKHFRNDHSTFMEMLSRNTNNHKGVVQLEEVSIDSENKLRQILSDNNIPSVPYNDPADEQSSMEKCSYNSIDNHNEKEEKYVKKGSKNQYCFTEWNSKVSDISGKQASTVNSTLCSLPKQSPYTSGSRSSSEGLECENLKRYSASYGDVANHVSENSIENCAYSEKNKNYVLENHTYSVLNRDCQSISYENRFSPPIQKKNKTLDHYFSDKLLNFSKDTNVLHHPGTFLHLKETKTDPKCENFSREPLNSSNNDMTTNTVTVSTKLENCRVSEPRNDADSELPPTFLVSDNYVGTRNFQPLYNMKKKISSHFVNSDVAQAQSSCNEETNDASKELYVSDYLAENMAFKPLRNQVETEHELNSDNGKFPILFKSVDDEGKTAGPTFADGGYSSLGTGSSAFNLLSLSNLWSRDVKEVEQRETMTVEQKLEEEYFRRKHCENVIQKLQSTVLEQQQKLAVAINIDKAKDHTILELHTAWKHLINHWQELEEQRHSISVRYSEEKEKHQKTVVDILQKVKQCELELSKALDLAKGYKEKNEDMEQKMKELQNSYAEESNAMHVSIQEGDKRFRKAEENVILLQQEVSEIKGKLEAAEKKACKEKEFGLKTQEEMKNVQQLLENLEADISIVKEENSSLRLRLKEERARSDVADQQIKSLKTALDESRRKEKLLETELKDQISILEKTKVDLRDYYQHQVELVVQEKLIEFQTQLDAAEASLHQEIEQKEKLALDAASKQIKHITEKNLLEVKLLEEKHREELHLNELQIAQANQQINQLQAQLMSHNNRKVEIAEKLHTVMKTQWQEALRIISGSSPIVQPYQIEQNIVLEDESSSNVAVRDLNISEGNNCNSVPPLHVPHSSSSSTTDEVPFNKEDQLTFRSSNKQHCSDGVVIHPENNDVVRCIEMLLNRPPGCPWNQETCKEKSSSVEKPVFGGKTFPQCSNIMENLEAGCNSDKIYSCISEDIKCIHAHSNNESNKPRKPPWK